MPATDLLGPDGAAHLLRRAGFGPQKGEVERFASLSREKAVDQLIGNKTRKKTPPRPKRDDRDNLQKMQRWWLKQMRSRKWRLHEKMVLFWHDHFPSSQSVVTRLRWLSMQNGVFREHALGSFRDLCYAVTRDAAMLDFLDGFRNQVESPNENYGRELMELFMLGVVDSNGVENYTQEDVRQLARACTGFRAERDKKGRFTDRVYLDPSRFDDGTKTIFAGMPYEASGNLGVENADGIPFPGGLNVIDLLLLHTDSDGRPTTARFLARKLWEWFAYPDPPIDLVDELADVFVAAGYQIAPLVKAILTHDEFYTDAARASTAKTPADYALQAMEVLGAKSNMKELPDYVRAMGLDLFNPPGVNGWNHSEAWLSTSRFLERFEFAQDLAAGRSKKVFSVNPKKLLDASATTTGALVDGLLARFGLTVPAATRQQLIDYVDGGAALGDDEWLEVKFRGLLLLLLTLPEYQVH